MPFKIATLITIHMPIIEHFSIFFSIFNQIDQFLCHWMPKLGAYKCSLCVKSKRATNKTHQKRMSILCFKNLEKNNFISMLGRYQKKCENQIGFQTGSQFETLRVSHWVMPFVKPDCKVLCNVRTKPLKLWSNVYLYWIKTLTWY